MLETGGRFLGCGSDAQRGACLAHGAFAFAFRYRHHSRFFASSVAYVRCAGLEGTSRPSTWRGRAGRGVPAARLSRHRANILQPREERLFLLAFVCLARGRRTLRAAWRLPLSHSLYSLCTHHLLLMRGRRGLIWRLGSASLYRAAPSATAASAWRHGSTICRGRAGVAQTFAFRNAWRQVSLLTWCVAPGWCWRAKRASGIAVAT